MNKNQTQKSSASQTLGLCSFTKPIVKRIKNWLMNDPVNLQILASLAFIAAVLWSIGGAHG